MNVQLLEEISEQIRRFEKNHESSIQCADPTHAFPVQTLSKETFN